MANNKVALVTLITSLAMLINTSVFANQKTTEQQIVIPENYQSRFIQYHSVDKPADGDKPAKIRFLYVNPEALVAARANQAAPYGTVLLMEDRKAELDANNQPLTDKHGRYIPSDEKLAIIIQEKQKNWGDKQPEVLRNGDWDYAFFDGNGVKKQGLDYTPCFACHKGQQVNDYNFTFNVFVNQLAVKK